MNKYTTGMYSAQQWKWTDWGLWGEDVAPKPSHLAAARSFPCFRFRIRSVSSLTSGSLGLTLFLVGSE